MGLSPSMRAEVDRVFIGDAPARLARLVDALERLASGGNEDARSTAAFEAHALRGAAATVGRSGLAELCAAVERAVGENRAEPPELRMLAARLRSARREIEGPAGRSRTALRGLLPRRFMTRLTLILALTIAPAIGVAAYNTLSTVGQSRSVIRRDLVAEASLVAQSMREFQQNVRLELSTVAQSSEVRSGSARGCTALLDRLAAGSNRFAGLEVVGGNGRVACGSPGAASLFGADAALLRHVGSSGHFAAGRLQRVAGRWLVPFADPLPGAPGSEIAAALPAQTLGRLLSTTRLPADGSVTVFDRGGRIIARSPDPGSHFVGEQAAVAAVARLHPAAGTTETRGVDGRQRLFAYRSSGQWRVAVGSTLAPSELRRLHTFVLSFVLVAALGLAGILAGLADARRALGRPLASLVTTAHRLGEGDLSTRTDPAVRGAELGELAVAFDTMADRLAARTAEHERATAELERLAAELERRVDERTAALDEARLASERHSEAKSGFLARLSHELRTPLNAIRGFSQLLAAEELPAEQAEAVRHVGTASEHMTRLVDELLDVARIEAGEFRVEPTAVPVRELVDKIVQLERGVAEDSGIALTAGEVADVAVHADPSRLRQVLLNLVSNGIAYNRPGGSVTVAVRALGDSRVEIEVADTGQGIPAGSLDRLFVPYDRLDRGPESSGLGLGLALSKRLVEAMHGTIGVQSRLGEGTRFVVTLPRASVAPEPAERATSQAPAGPRTVLCVDDNATNIRLLELLLGGRQVDVVGAASAAEGFAAAEAEAPSLILLDLGLPDESGEQLLRRFRADERFRAVPIVIMSGDASRESVRRLLEAGADDYLTKPIEVDRAAELFARLLAR